MTPEIYAIQGLAQLGLGAVNSFQAAQRQREARADYEKSLAEFRSQDTSNLYANLENPYEDLTVNQQQAQFQAQQQQQGLADTMQGLRGAAGGSGIAAFAQSIANQQARNLQAASASIGQQESANQRMAAQGAMQIQSMERGGAAQSRKLESEMRSTELGMSMNQLAAANIARQQAFGQIAGGVGNIGAAGLEAYQQGYFNTSGEDKYYTPEPPPVREGAQYDWGSAWMGQSE